MLSGSLTLFDRHDGEKEQFVRLKHTRTSNVIISFLFLISSHIIANTLTYTLNGIFM